MATPVPLLTTADLARRLNVTEIAVRSLRQLGLGPTWIRVGKHARYELRTVERWIAAQAHGVPAKSQTPEWGAVRRDSRRLIARTCPSCERLLPGDAFAAPGIYYNARCDDCCHPRHVPMHVSPLHSDVPKAPCRCGYEWTGPELELLGRDDLTHREKALMLGRTYDAVKNAVAKLQRGDPRTTALAGQARRKAVGS